jgi:hypothetical protein
MLIRTFSDLLKSEFIEKRIMNVKDFISGFFLMDDIRKASEKINKC